MKRELENQVAAIVLTAEMIMYGTCVIKIENKTDEIVVLN